jgi:hypothetical protein
MCTHSNVHPCSQSPTPIVVVFGCWCPRLIVRLCSCPSKPIDVYLESQMLKEVSRAVGFIRLCSRAGINPHSNSRCLCPWRMLGCNLSIISRCTHGSIKCHLLPSVHWTVWWILSSRHFLRRVSRILSSMGRQC